MLPRPRWSTRWQPTSARKAGHGGVDDTETGLAHVPGEDWEPDFVRDQANALQPLVPDLGARAAVEAEPEIDIGSFGERFDQPDSGLGISADDARIMADIATLNEQAADRKLRALLDKAEAA